MTDGTVDELTLVDVVLLNEFGSLYELIGRRLPLHVEDLFPRADELLRLAMAVQAPLHDHGVDLLHEGHLVNAAMAGGAADAFVNVNGVIEVNELRQVVDALPMQRNAGRPTVADRLENGSIKPDFGMARHARVGRRDAGERRGFNRGVAVAALDAQPRDMVLMAERDRLLDKSVDARAPGGDINLGPDPDCDRDQEQAPKDGHFGHGVHVGGE
jgi:hypothetical protein